MAEIGQTQPIKSFVKWVSDCFSFGSVLDESVKGVGWEGRWLDLLKILPTQLSWIRVWQKFDIFGIILLFKG